MSLVLELMPHPDLDVVLAGGCTSTYAAICCWTCKKTCALGPAQVVLRIYIYICIGLVWSHDCLRYAVEQGRLVMQGQFEHAVEVFYRALVLGVRSQRPDLIAMCTALVGAAGQRYREMLAETNGRLSRDRYSRELARVRPTTLWLCAPSEVCLHGFLHSSVQLPTDTARVGS